MLVVEKVKINANTISVFNSCIDAPPVVRESDYINFMDNFHDLEMSAGAVKTLKKSVNTILYLSRKAHYNKYRRAVGCLSFRQNAEKQKAVKYAHNSHLCTFITLTLPAAQTHTDRELTTNLLNPFLSYARKYFHVRYYVWKKELQQNGNLHFHLVTDRFIKADCLRNAWNRLCNKGKVKGVAAPFDYVDRYRAKMLNLYSNGFDAAVVADYVANLDGVKQQIADDVEKFETDNQREITAPEYDEIFNRVVNATVEKFRAAYYKEMQRPEKDRYTNPNSTDIEAVKSPAAVAAYVAKYISKDITDNPILTDYITTVKGIKETITGLLIDARNAKANGDESAAAAILQQVETFKQHLAEIRETKCPILGHLWFKSKTLTPFVAGVETKGSDKKIRRVPAVDVLNLDTDNELRNLHYALDYTYREQMKEYQKAIKAYNTDPVNNPHPGKPPRNLIVYSYEKDEKGNNTTKIMCTTYLVNIFELMQWKTADCKKQQFPFLVKMWRSFVGMCILENKKKGYYEF